MTLLRGVPVSERQHPEHRAGDERGGDAAGLRGVQSGCLVLHIRRRCEDHRAQAVDANNDVMGSTVVKEAVA